MIDTGLQGKVAIVTGANHGIGAATARALAAEGVAVLINYLRVPAPAATNWESETPGMDFYNARRTRDASEVIAAIRQAGGRAEALEADLSDPATVPLLFKRAEEAFGPVDILVNNADYCEQDTFLPLEPGDNVLAGDGFPTALITPEKHDQHFAVNSRAVALMMAEFARRAVQHGRHWGRIINISTDGAPGFAREISYGASKAALESYSRAAAMELGKFGITVNIISPGPIQTGWIAPELEQAVIADTPLGRAGQPEDIADVIVFLASHQGRWISAQTISVSGGRRLF